MIRTGTGTRNSVRLFHRTPDGRGVSPIKIVSTTLIFFDIDGTILSTNGAGKVAFSMALHEAHNLDDPLAEVTFAGATDWGIYEQTLAKHGVTPTTKSREKFFAAMEQALKKTLISGKPFTYPGAAESISRLANHPRVQLGLITGNTEACARVKLGYFDLEQYFPFGGFGSDHPDRVEIARIAMKRAAIHSSGPGPVQYDQRILIGDTPADIDAAHGIGATALAVLTGDFNEDTLRSAGADIVAQGIPSALARGPTFPGHVK